MSPNRLDQPDKEKESLMSKTSYRFSVTLAAPYEQALLDVKAALRAEGKEPVLAIMAELKQYVRRSAIDCHTSVDYAWLALP